MTASRGSFDKITCALFALVLLLPASGYIWRKPEPFSKTEQRQLAQWPSFRENLQSLQLVPKKMDSFFNDHLFLRDNLIKIHNFVKYFVFRQSPSNRVRLGMDGWLFYHGEMGVWRVLNSKELESMNSALGVKQRWLNKAGIQYLFLAVPDKAAVYSEFLPERAVGGDYKARLNAVENYINIRNPGLVLNLQTILLAKKNEDLVYYKTDTHWNYLGAYFAYQHILERLQPKFPELSPLDRSYFNLELSKFSNLDLSKMMGLGEFFTEESYFQPTKYTECGSKKAVDSSHFPKDPHGRAPVAYECPNKSLKILMLGDSFMQNLVPYLKEHTKRLVVVYGHPPLAALQKVVQKEQPDIVLEESVGRFLVRDWLAE